MAQYSDSLLQEIRTRVDIVDLVGQYVPLRRAGANHKGLCPFHKEKTPSFHVHPEKQIYRCFGCGASGNVFGFLMQYEGLAFPEAVRFLAERAGVKLEQAGPPGPSRQLTDRLKAIHKAAAILYARVLLGESEGEVGRRYLRSRGLDAAMAKSLGLGFAPESWDFAKNLLGRQGFDLSELEASGLIKRADEGDRYYDRFRNRLMFPITDPYGTVIGFGGRTLGDDPAKYINSPESVLYHKGQQLFGLHLARDAIKETGWLLLVEGNFDCVLPWSRGIKNVAASLGTALTQSHARLIKRYTDRVVLLFDQDDAGQTSQRRAAELLLGEGFEVRIATLDKHKDPADYVLHEGGDALRARLDHASQAVVHYARQAAEGIVDPTPRDRAKAVVGILPLIEKILDPIERAESLAYVAKQLGVDETLVRAELGRRQPPAPARVAPAAPGARPSAEFEDELEQRLVRALAVRPDLVVRFLESHDPTELQGDAARQILSALSTMHSDDRTPEIAELMDRITSESLRARVAAWVFEGEAYNPVAVFDACVNELNQRRLTRHGKDLTTLIAEAEKAGDFHRVQALCKELVTVSKEKKQEERERAAAFSPRSEVENRETKRALRSSTSFRQSSVSAGPPQSNPPAEPRLAPHRDSSRDEDPGPVEMTDAADVA